MAGRVAATDTDHLLGRNDPGGEYPQALRVGERHLVDDRNCRSRVAHEFIAVRNHMVACQGDALLAGRVRPSERAHRIAATPSPYPPPYHPPPPPHPTLLL